MKPMPWFTVAVLALAALGTGAVLWLLREPPRIMELVGPPRSDYSLDTFELVALDEHGRESFFVEGPRLERHPALGTIDIEQPRFAFPDDTGERWSSRADRAFVNADATHMRLTGDVRIDSPADSAAPIAFASPALDVFPRDNRIETEAAVTVTEPGSILRARGLRADLNTRRVELLAEVRIRHEPPARRR